MKLKFNKEKDNYWYIDLPHYPFAHHNLMMVAGADWLCEFFAQKQGTPDRAEVDVTINNDSIDDRTPDVVMLRKDKDIYGATYDNYCADGNFPSVKRNGIDIDVRQAWLCPVTLFVFHRYPKKINLYG